MRNAPIVGQALSPVKPAESLAESRLKAGRRSSDSQVPERAYSSGRQTGNAMI